MRIFYSWQSDTPSKIGRRFIREAIDLAVEKIHDANSEIADAERMEVDQDTQEVLGSPSIVETILEKISKADVLICDVTITGTTDKGKLLINSNVAIELGYGLGVAGYNILLTVMNVNYGLPGRLPFDLRHRRFPTQFCLSPSSTSNERAVARDALAGRLASILSDYLEKMDQPLELRHVPVAPTRSVGEYWKDNEDLIVRDRQTI